ncbi:hypothetical protein CsSME_00039259 [Camellia sinensis var. sinensis]
MTKSGLLTSDENFLVSFCLESVVCLSSSCPVSLVIRGYFLVIALSYGLQVVYGVVHNMSCDLAACFSVVGFHFISLFPSTVSAKLPQTVTLVKLIELALPRPVLYITLSPYIGPGPL